MLLFVLASIVLLVVIVRRLLRMSEGPLGWEHGRRKARQPFKKSQKVYEMFGVTSSEEYFINSRGVELFCKQWLPLHGSPRAVLFYCHGYGDTCTHTFEDEAIKLASEQFAVVSMDYEGHGLSAGLHCDVRKFSNLVDDVIEVSSGLRMRADFAGLPFFLYGESMGGAVAIQVHRRQPHAWAGALLVAPMCKISDEFLPPPAVVSFLKLLVGVIPTWKLVPTKDITDVGFRDIEKRERVRNNPVGYRGKPRLMTALQLLLTTEEIGSSLDEVSLPLLVMHGAQDVVTNPDFSKLLVAQSSSTDKTLRLYEGAWHGLTAGEPDEVASMVTADMVAWLRQRCPPRGLNLGCAQSTADSQVKLASWSNPLFVPGLEDDAQSAVSSS